MLINTRDFGELDISPEEVIDFPEGIYAFEDDHRFVLISPRGENLYPMWLQSLDNENLCFIVFDPKEFVADYSVTIDDDAMKTLGAGKDFVPDYLVIAVVPEDYIDATVNMKSPIVINSEKRTAMQVIAQESYPIKYPAFKKEEI